MVFKGYVGCYYCVIVMGEFVNVFGLLIKLVFVGGWDLMIGVFGGSLVQFMSNENLLIDFGYDSFCIDQFILSFEYQFGSNMGILVNLVKKEGCDFVVWCDVGSIFEIVQWIDGDFDFDGVFDGIDFFVIGNVIDVIVCMGGECEFVIINCDEMDNDIEVVLVEFYKCMLNCWLLNVNFIYFKLEGCMFDSLGGVSVQQCGGLQFCNFGCNFNDFVNLGGCLCGDIFWQVKVQFVYQLFKGFLVVVNFLVCDGVNCVCWMCVLMLFVGQLMMILVVEWGDFGCFDEQYFFDLCFEKDFKLNDCFCLVVIVDVFNVFNQDVVNLVLSLIGILVNFNIDLVFVWLCQGMLGVKLCFQFLDFRWSEGRYCFWL